MFRDFYRLCKAHLNKMFAAKPMICYLCCEFKQNEFTTNAVNEGPATSILSVFIGTQQIVQAIVNVD